MRWDETQKTNTSYMGVGRVVAEFEHRVLRMWVLVKDHEEERWALSTPTTSTFA
jgi:hypothetical protein